MLVIVMVTLTQYELTLMITHTGPYHPAMRDKLLQMNQVLEDMVKLMNTNRMNDTVLFVFGDHGMTDDGNHGTPPSSPALLT